LAKTDSEKLCLFLLLKTRICNPQIACVIMIMIM